MQLRKRSESADSEPQDRLRKADSGCEQGNGRLQGQGRYLETKLKNTHIDRAITSAVLDENSGVDPRALPDILERARRVYTVEVMTSSLPRMVKQ